MNTALLFVILLLLLVLMCFVVYYFFTQQSLREISDRLARLQPVQATRRTADAVRHERAYHHDQLVLLEADLSKNPRDSLTQEELDGIDKARRTIKNCIDELKQYSEWIGLPFDFEWTEILLRLPNVNTLYRKSISDTPDAGKTPEIAKVAPARVTMLPR